MPPTTKKTIAATPYMMPIFLWSTVNSHDRQPVAATGRRNTPRARDGVTTGAAAAPTIAGTGDRTFDDGHGWSILSVQRASR